MVETRSEPFQRNTPGRAILIAVLLAGFFPHTPVRAGDEKPLERFSQLEIRFGIPIQITLYVADEPTAKQRFAEAFAEAKRLDRIFSDYDPDSEARQLVTKPETKLYAVSDDLLFVMKKSREVARKTDGVFDVTVGPLTHLWRKTMRFQRPPDSDRLAEVLGKVGTKKWCIYQNQIWFREPDMRFDFGGIAKGYALDRMAAVLREQGVESFLIDAGGDILCGAPPPEREAWRIEIERPGKQGGADSEPGEPLVLELAHRAVATSGATYQSVTLDGVRYSHIVDPRTGYGVQNLANVTVIADSGWLADALASAVSVGGKDVMTKPYENVEIIVTEAAATEAVVNE